MHLRLAATLALLASLAPILAGCVTQPPAGTLDPSGEAPDVRPELVAPAFLPAVKLGTMELGAEPNVAVAPDGTVYVSTPLALWRSDDLGHTYQAIGDQKGCTLGSALCEGRNPGLVGGGDGSLAITPEGFLHWAGLGGGHHVPYQRSVDRGESWSAAVDLAPAEDGYNVTDRQWIAADDDGTLYAVWRYSQRPSEGCAPALDACVARPDAEWTHTINLNVSRDGGATWTPSVIADAGVTGPIATDPASDAIYLPLNRDGLRVLRSADRGLTWTETPLFAGVIAHGFYIFPVAAVDAAGNVYVVWSEDRDAPSHPDERVDPFVSRPAARPRVHLAVSRDGGASFSEPLLLSSPDRPAVFPWIAAGDEGRVAVVWYDAALPTPGDRLPNVWNVAVAMSVTADEDEPVFETAFATPEPIHVGSICTMGAFCTVTGGDRSRLDFFEVRILPDGSPVLAYVADGDVPLGTAKVFATRMTEGTKLRG